MAEGSVNLGSAWGEVRIDTAGSEQAISSLSSTLRSAGTAMSLGVTAPLVGIGVAALNSAGDFEQSMNIMAQVSGATGEQMATLQAQALEMGAVTSFSAGEAAEAQLELAKAGMEPLEVMAALPGVLDAAAAGGMGLAQSAGLVSAALNAFSLEASESGNVANMLAAAANASAVDMGDLAAGVQQGGFAFAAAGQSLDDLVASTAILGNVGLTGSDAGTALKNAVMRLINPTKEAAGMMNELGINVFDAQGAMLPWADVIDQFDAGLAGLTEQERNNALATILMSDGMKAMIPLLDEGKDGFLDMKDSINEEGQAAATAGARMKGMRGAVEYLKGSIDSFLIGTALPFLDSLSGIVRVVADGISAFGALPRPVIDAGLAFAAVLAAAGPLMLALSGVGAAIAFILSPVGLLVAGVAALAAGFVLWQSNFGGIQQRAATFANQLKDMAEAATGIDFDGVADGLRAFGRYIGAVVEDGDALNDWLTHLPTTIQPAAQAFGQFVAAVGGLAQTGDIGAFVTDIQGIDWGGALAVFTTGLTTLKVGVVAALQAIDWAAALETASTWLDGLKSGVTSALQSVDWAGALTTAGEWLASLRDGVVAAVTSIPWLTHLATAGNFVSGLTQGVVNRLITINWGALLTQAGDWLAGLRGHVVAALGRIDWGAALTAAATWLNTLKTNVVAAIQGIDWGAALTAAGNAFASLETAVTNGLNALGFSGAATSLANIKAAIGGLPASLTALATNFNAARSAVGAFGVQAAAALAPVAAFFAPAIGRLQAVFAGLPASLAPLQPKLAALGAAFGGLVKALQPLMLLLGGALAIAADFTINRLATAFETLPTIIGTIIDQVTATIQLITTIINSVIAGVQAAIDGDWTAVWESAETIARGFSTFFRGLFSRLGTFMGAVAKNISKPIIDTLTDLGVDVQPLLDGIKGTFDTVWSGIQSAIQAVVDIVGTVTSTIGEFKTFLDGLQLRNPFEGIAAAGQTVLDAIGKVGNAVSGGGEDGDPSTPEAGGTSYFRGGLATVNERGYEQVVLPAGSRVYTHAQTNNMDAAGEGRTININLGGVTVNSPMDAHRLAGTLRDQLAMAGV